MNTLPQDVLDIIYSYDNKYATYWNRVLNELKLKIAETDIVLSSMICSRMFNPEDLTEELIGMSFSEFYFKRYCNHRFFHF